MAPSEGTTIIVIGSGFDVSYFIAATSHDTSPTLLIVEEEKSQFANETLSFKIDRVRFEDFDVELLDDKHPFDKFINPKKSCLKKAKRNITGMNVYMSGLNSFALSNSKMCCRSSLSNKRKLAGRTVRG